MSSLNESEPNKDLKKHDFKKRSIISGFFLIFFIGVFLGSIKSNSVLAVVNTYSELETFADVLSLIETNYVDEVEPDKLVEGAINGMLRSLDPHSSYMSEEMFKEMQVETEGEFGGLGIEITIESGWLTIVTPMEDTPAWDIGLKAGDRILKVDDAPTHEMTLMAAVRKMRGKPGSKVTITIIREGFDEPRDFVITRKIIHVTSIKYEMLPDKWGYIRIRGFSKDTGLDAGHALDDLKEQGMKGLILDMRNNPGGLLNQAVSVSELFLRKGELIVYTKGRMPSQNLRFTVKSDIENNEYPMVVLVNEGSASASEIVAGAMQDLKRAIVVGMKSFGKGSVQTIIPLKGNAGLRLTTARYFTPSGRQIHGIGIIPDVEVKQEPLKPTEEKEKTKVKVDIKNRGKILNGHNGASKNGGDESEENVESPPKSKFTGTKRPIVNLEQDTQLNRAIEVLKSWTIIDDIQHRRFEPAK